MTAELLSKIDIIELNEAQNKGTFQIAPLERGYGQTIGNSLRRVLLSSLKGAAVTNVRFVGISHEFTTIDGVIEDVPEIILNLKGIAAKLHGEGPVYLHLTFEGPMDLTAGHFNEDVNLAIVNTDHHIATLNEDARVELEIEFSQGTGYRMATQDETEEIAEAPEAGTAPVEYNSMAQTVGTIPVDASFSPVEAANFTVSNQRVGKQTDFDRLEMEVETNGTLTAQDALAEAASVLIRHLQLFVDLPQMQLESAQSADAEAEAENELLHQPIDALNLGLRSYNCLKRAGIDTVGDITARSYNEMLKIKNFGKKSIAEVEEKLAEINLTFREDDAEQTEE